MSDFIDLFVGPPPGEETPVVDMNDVLFEALLALSDSFQSQGYYRIAEALEDVLGDFVNQCWPAPERLVFKSRRKSPPSGKSAGAPLLLLSPVTEPPKQRLEKPTQKATGRKGPWTVSADLPMTTISNHPFPLARISEIDRFSKSAECSGEGLPDGLAPDSKAG